MSRESRPLQPISGHVFRVDRRRGPQWYAKYRLPDGRPGLVVVALLT
jgi:hypothetical protein